MATTNRTATECTTSKSKCGGVGGLASKKRYRKDKNKRMNKDVTCKQYLKV